MSDEKPPMPPQPTTKQIPAVSVPSDTMNAILVELRGMRGDVQDVKGDVDMLVGQGRAMAKWRGEVEEWRATVDSALTRNSSRVKQPSSHDLETASAVASEVVARTALETKVTSIEAKVDAQGKMLAANTATTDEIKKAVTGWFKKHPAVGVALAGVIIEALRWAHTALTAGPHL